jgi:hypothetical protein
MEIENFELWKTSKHMVESPKKVDSKTDNNNHSLTMNLCKEHDVCQTILVMLTFTIDSTPTSQICTFCRGPTHVVENCPYKSNQVPTFVTKSIFCTTQLAISISSQIPIIQVPIVFECNPSFTIAPNYPIT